ncbi:hypothetical protein ASG31_14845 [Chryseobacterium sp. Leaf404]|uniref:hypothetical protein n=1 Tax=unclassified Chryseobacterium TaxID=2593645 RepID=UPI0006F31D39|nr:MULTISPECIES: hypothetical protein [unclassified Chryseobacterium]KQT15535.1 hypothetical protein ASG31_14845 [Chryseobacterium sp. Leaf404]
MKIWSIVTLLIVLNFTALPSIAAVMKWDLAKTNVVLNEEETHSHYSSFLSVVEKTLPKTLSVYDHLKFFEPDSQGALFVQTDDRSHLSPYLNKFSPPPEA